VAKSSGQEESLQLFGDRFSYWQSKKAPEIMNKAILIIRTLLGLAFVVFGFNFFYGFLETPKPSGLAADFMGVIIPSGYLAAVKVLEIAGGLLLLSKRFAPLGILILGPIVVNIVFYDIYLLQAFNPISTAVAAMFTFVLIVYRKNFRGVFAGPRR